VASSILPAKRGDTKEEIARRSHQEESEIDEQSLSEVPQQPRKSVLAEKITAPFTKKKLFQATSTPDDFPDRIFSIPLFFFFFSITNRSRLQNISFYFE